MDKEQVDGKFEKAGRATNNPDLEAESAAEHAEDNVREAYEAKKIADAATE